MEMQDERVQVNLRTERPASDLDLLLIGRVDQVVLSERLHGPRVALLAGGEA